MNALHRDLKKLTGLVECMEAKRAAKDPWRLKFHIMPPAGWMNDPNGLCQFQGVYHVFYQYAPFEVLGGLKFWGHTTSRDLIRWKDEGTALYADQPFDCHGVYSGSALIENGTMHLFYTGNVKHAGVYDYVSSGRTSATVHTASRDGIHFQEKQLLMTNEDYPENCTCHVRDPKVWRDQSGYLMVQGARRKGNQGQDQGEVLVFASKDLKKWTLANRISSQNPFGYMWECPDFFRLDGKQFLICCPQGVEQDGRLYQNLYQNGYFEVNGEIDGRCELGGFQVLDHGPDFYAPQTFRDEKGRRILIAWAGMPDAEYYNPTAERGWQHCMTVPRVLKCRGGKLIQNPVEELQQLWSRAERRELGKTCVFENLETYEACLDIRQPENLQIVISDRAGGRITLSYDRETGTAVLNQEGKMAAGRKSRSVKLEMLTELRILADTSILEFFFNGGEAVMTTRYYPAEGGTRLEAAAGEGSLCLKDQASA